MSYNEILAIVENNLVPNHEEIVDEIKLRISSGSTGGEIASSVGGYLKSLRDQKHPVYFIIKTEIDLYLSQFIWK